jgi:hypothetical protein
VNTVRLKFLSSSDACSTHMLNGPMKTEKKQTGFGFFWVVIFIFTIERVLHEKNV